MLGSAVTDGRVVERMGGVARSEFERRLRLEEDGAGHVLSGTHRTDHGATAAGPLRPGTNAPYIQLLACWRAVTE